MSDDTTTSGGPTVVIVGRPNVGKSPVFNRIIGSQPAIVDYIGCEPSACPDRYRAASPVDNVSAGVFCISRRSS